MKVITLFLCRYRKKLSTPPCDWFKEGQCGADGMPCDADMQRIRVD